MWGALANATDKHLQNTSKSERNADAQHNAIGDPLSHSAPPLNIDAKDTDLGNMRKEVPQSALELILHIWERGLLQQMRQMQLKNTRT